MSIWAHCAAGAPAFRFSCLLRRSAGSAATAAHADRAETWFFDDIFGPQRAAEGRAAQTLEGADRQGRGEAPRPAHGPHRVRELRHRAQSRHTRSIAISNSPSAATGRKVPTGKTLRVGEQEEAVGYVRARLEVTDGLKPTNGNAWEFDEYVEAAVKRFQRRHGIPPNGVVDRRTRRADECARPRPARAIAHQSRAHPRAAGGRPPGPLCARQRPRHGAAGGAGWPGAACQPRHRRPRRSARRRPCTPRSRSSTSSPIGTCRRASPSAISSRSC